MIHVKLFDRYLDAIQKDRKQILPPYPPDHSLLCLRNSPPDLIFTKTKSTCALNTIMVQIQKVYTTARGLLSRISQNALLNCELETLQKIKDSSLEYSLSPYEAKLCNESNDQLYSLHISSIKFALEVISQITTYFLWVVWKLNRKMILRKV
jgi:hypothetical protein